MLNCSTFHSRQFKKKKHLLYSMCLGLLRTVISQKILIITYWWFSVSVLHMDSDAAQTANEKEMWTRRQTENACKVRFLQDVIK